MEKEGNITGFRGSLEFVGHREKRVGEKKLEFWNWSYPVSLNSTRVNLLHRKAITLYWESFRTKTFRTSHLILFSKLPFLIEDFSNFRSNKTTKRQQQAGNFELGLGLQDGSQRSWGCVQVELKLSLKHLLDIFHKMRNQTRSSSSFARQSKDSEGTGNEKWAGPSDDVIVRSSSGRLNFIPGLRSSPMKLGNKTETKSIKNEAVTGDKHTSSRATVISWRFNEGSRSKPIVEHPLADLFDDVFLSFLQRFGSFLSHFPFFLGFCTRWGRGSLEGSTWSVRDKYQESKKKMIRKEEEKWEIEHGKREGKQKKHAEQKTKNT